MCEEPSGPISKKVIKRNRFRYKQYTNIDYKTN